MGLAIGRGEFPTGTEVWSAVLKCISGFAQLLETIIHRDNARNLLAHFPTGLAAEQMRALRINRGCEFPQDFPFRARFSNLPRNFRTKNDASLGDRFRPAVIL